MNFTFVVSDDELLHVVDTEAELQGAFEGVDVEADIYRFFDASGNPLIAEFTVPNTSGRSFGRFWVGSGAYRLRPGGEGSAPHLLEFLPAEAGLVPNRHFLDIASVRHHLLKTRVVKNDLR